MTIEPSVWDFLLAKLQFWEKSEIDFSKFLNDEYIASLETPSDFFAMDSMENEKAAFQSSTVQKEAAFNSQKSRSPWRLLVSLLSLLLGQLFMELGGTGLNPFVAFFQKFWNETTKIPALANFFYLIAAGLLLWQFLDGGFTTTIRAAVQKKTIMQPVKTGYLGLSIPFLATAFLLMGQNRFTFLNLVCWFLGVLFFILGLWVDEPIDWKKRFNALREAFTKSGIQFRIRWFDIALILVAILAVFFRFYLLDSVPAEMFSDQAEKLLDVQDVLDGQYPIFFIRNTGREAFQMYLSALVAKFTGIQFLTLKIGTALCGLFMLPYVYLLGKEIFNRRVGLYAVFFAAIAYWPNVISRVGLRYILYAAFTAPTLYYLFRGLRRQHRNDFILAGIFLGIGLHGYSSFRFLPIVVSVVAVIYFLHHFKDTKKLKIALLCVLIIGLVSFTIFLPLFRYWTQDPGMFSYRMATRLGTAEASYPDHPVKIFASNFIRASLMFFNDNGEIWVHSVTGRPALDLVTAVSYFLGVVLMLFSYFKKWSWEYLSLLVSIPLLLMPSILSLAFPGENPCLNRTSAAMVPVFVVAGFGIESLVAALLKKMKTKRGKAFVMTLLTFLLLASALLNYELVFNQYADQFLRGAWNTSDIGEVIEHYAESFGSYESAYVIPYPYWVDTRLVGINAGMPRKDYALPRERIQETVEAAGSKLFIFKYDDLETMEVLSLLYPEGALKFYEDQYEGKDFYQYLVP